MKLKELFAHKWAKNALIAAGCVAAVYCIIYVDVVMRARSAYMEGEKFWQWNENPKLKEESLNGEFEKNKSRLDKKVASGRITQEAYDRELGVLKFNRDRQLSESSIKYAYIWYQTAVELFSPPESIWVVRSREKMGKAKELWKKELDLKKVPYEDYMLE